VLIIGANPRLEAPVLNARIRKRWRQGDLQVGVVGEAADLTYATTYLGAGPETLADLVAGKNSFADVLKAAQKPLIIVGQGALARVDGVSVLANAAKLAENVGAVSGDWNGFSVLHTAASRVGGLDIGFVPNDGGMSVAAMQDAASKGNLDVLFLLGADEMDMSAFGEAFVVYIGTHGDRGAHRADVILPGAAYTEKSGLYVNTEGRVQLGDRAGFPPGEAREDWAILRALSAVLGKTLPFDTLGALRGLLGEAYPHMLEIDGIKPGEAGEVSALAKGAGKMEAAGFANAVTEFYLTNPIARASAVMAECSALAKARTAEAAE
jgi:NADH-quinone oxidoreductase subunit G